MQVILSDNEIEAFLTTKAMLLAASTPVPQFLHWVADRLVKVHGDDELVDFVHALRDRAKQLHHISQKLGIDRGPERVP